MIGIIHRGKLPMPNKPKLVQLAEEEFTIQKLLDQYIDIKDEMIEVNSGIQRYQERKKLLATQLDEMRVKIYKALEKDKATDGQ